MARRRRFISNQGAYHAYNRAESGAPIFESDEAKQVFLEIILSAAMRFSWQVHAYAIMTNHFHLMVTTPLGNLSQGMHALQSAFANKHKVFRGSIGHVFQSRFGSNHYPIGPLAGRKLDYVHLNPVRAGIVTLAELKDYRWTSYRALWRPHQRGFLTIGFAVSAMHGLRDDSVGWEAYAERLVFTLATEHRPATDEELFGLVRKEKAGGLPSALPVKQVVGKGRELLLAEERQRWEEALVAELLVAGKHESQLDEMPHNLPWKMTLAKTLKGKHGATSTWIAQSMHFSSAAYLRKLLASS